MAAIKGLIDIRDQLATRKRGSINAGPFESRPLNQKRGVVVHYSGPPVDLAVSTLTILQREARYHVEKSWSAAGQPPLYGDGLMYHVAVGPDGRAYLCRDLGAVLWHCGAWPQNATALSLHVPIGGDQRATPAQLTTLQRIVDEWCAATGTPRAEIWGHQELQPTACPGTLMADFIYPYRNRQLIRAENVMTTGRWFPETQHYVGGVFWEFWVANGGLPIFGYPLSDEHTEDGMTVQYFERAVFEWHPQNVQPWKVLLRRLGAEALEQQAVRS